MEKLRSLTSKIPLPSSNPFKFNSDHNVLKRSQTARTLRGVGNPFLDGPSLENVFFTFLALCTMAAVASFQHKWVGVSGGTGFTLFLLIVSFILTVLLLVVPIVYDRWDKLKRVAQFLNQTRSTFILHAFGTALMLLAAFIVTISAWTEKGCKDAANDPHASLGDSFENGLKGWCTTKKASAVFDWLSFAAWAALLILTALVFRRERREPSFVPPSSPGISYANILAQDDQRYVDKTEPEHVHTPTYEETPTAGYGYGRPADVEGRASVDAYGAFDGDGMPRNEEQSRTMPLAYNDPCASRLDPTSGRELILDVIVDAQIRQSLNNPAVGTGYTAPPGTGLPNPPTYGYR
ncbi:hypothetical protein P7C73_g5831, partial [Tremellales sp. Uapishka_1]